MNMPRPVVVTAFVALVVTLLASATLQRPAAVAIPDQVGWAGPHPSAIRSYHTKLAANQTMVQVVGSVPGINGMIITDISVGVGSFSTQQELELVVANNPIWRGFFIQQHDLKSMTVNLESGVPVPSGTTLFLRGNALPLESFVTVCGYVW